MRRLLWPALTTIVLLAMGVSLGVWQVERLAWKRDLLAQIDLGERTPPEPLGPQPVAFRRVTVHGRFLPVFAQDGAEVRGTRTGAVMGAQLISPLVRPGQETLVVDRGWAPLDFDGMPPAGDVTIEGYVRPAEKPIRFGAADDPAARRFYALDPEAIAASLGVAKAEPFTLVALGPSGALPEPATVLPRPPNDHLSYAITWFAMSFGLMVIFGLYARQTLRAEKP